MPGMVRVPPGVRIDEWTRIAVGAGGGTLAAVVDCEGGIWEVGGVLLGPAGFAGD